MKKGVIISVFIFLVSVGFATKVPQSPGTTFFNEGIVNPAVQSIVDELKVAKQSGNAGEVLRLERELSTILGIRSVPEAPNPELKSNFVCLPRREVMFRPSGFDIDWRIPQTSGPSKEASPWIGSTRSGTLFAVYEEYDGVYSPQPYLVIVRSDDFGRSWSTFAAIYNSSVKYQVPKLVVGEGTQNWVFIAYEKVPTAPLSNTTVEVAKISFDGSSYEFHEVDGSWFSSKVKPFITVDTDTYYYVYVSYVKYGTFSSEVCFARSTDFGSTWTIIDASPDNQGKGFTSIAYGKNANLYLVSQTAEESGQIWFNKSSNYGATWGTPVLISTTHKDTYPIIAASHTTDEVLVSYVYQYSSSDRDIYYSYSNNSGASWTTSRYAAITTREEKYPVAGVDNIAFYILYWDAGGIKMKKMALGGSGFTETMNVSDDDMAADNFICLSIAYQRDIPTPIAIWSKAITSTNWDIFFDMNPCSPPVASANISPTSGPAPLTVRFEDNSRGTVTTREWDLGDGTRESGTTFTHTYSRQGRYTVRLTVSSFCGTSSATYSIDVGCAPLNAAINASVTSGTAPLTVNFNDASTGTPTSWAWDFGDGTTSTERNPTHTYETIGSYNVTLRVIDDCGATSVAHIGIEVTPAPTPIIVINPSSLEFDTVSVGDRASLDLIISNRGTGDLTVGWSSSIGDGFYVYGLTSYIIRPDSFITVQLFFAPTAERIYNGVFTIMTNDPFRPTINVPLRGYGTMRYSTGVYLTPSILNFDSVAVGSAARQRITLRNNSSSVVRVTRYEMRGSGFTVLTDDTISVAPGGYRFITVEFLPTTEIAYYETLFVYTTAGNFNVLLSGTGYSRMICYTLGLLKLCAEIIGDGRAERNITFKDLDDNVILTVGGPIAFIDLARMAGTGIGYFHYADGSSEMCFVGGFDIDYLDGRIITHFSVDTTVYDDSLLGAPFRAGVGVSPVTVDIASHWWSLAGGLEISRGGVTGEIRIARVRDWFRRDHYALSDFDLEILGGAFTVRFADVHVSGDTIEAGRLYLRARESLVPGLTGTSFFEIDARSLRIYHGALVRLDLDLQFPDFNIPAGAGQVINIRRPRLRFEFRDIDGDGVADLYGIGGGGIFAYRNLLPSLGSDTYINIRIMIRREGLDDAVLGFHGFSPGIPLGTSGFFITGVEGDVRHLCHPEDIIVRFSCDLRGGPSLPLVGGIVEMTPVVTIDFERDLLALEGTVRFLRGLTSGRGGFIFMARDIGGGFGMLGYASVTAGLSSFASLEGGVNAHMWRDRDDAEFHFTGLGYVEVIVRSRVIFWLMPTDDIRVGAYAYFGEFRHGGDSGGHWGVKGELAWRPFGIAPSIGWIDGTFIMDAHEYRLVDTRRRVKGSTAFEISNCVIGNTDINTFVIRTSASEHPRISLITPEGELITQAVASTTDSLAPVFYAENVSYGYRYCGYVVHGRRPGTWQIQIEGLSSSDADHPIQVKGFYNPLELAISTRYEDGRVTVSGNISNMGGRAEKAWINIYMARRTSSSFRGDGTLIKTIETTGDGPFTYSFTQEDIGARGGEYIVYATAEDNINRFASAVDSINIVRFPEDRTPPLPPLNLVAVVKGDEVWVKWENSPSVDVTGYKIYRGEFIDSIGAYVWDEVVDVGEVTYYTIFNTHMMVRDMRKLAVGARAYDNSGNESELVYATILGRDETPDNTPPTVSLETPAYDLDQGILMVFWNTRDTDIRGFILEIGLDENNIYERIELPPDTRNYTFTRLRRGIDYYIRLRAYDNYLNISEPATMSIPFYYENDRDGDGLPDWWEEYYFSTIERYSGTDDPDGDLVPNSTEYANGTSPLSTDTDNDRISDYVEIHTDGLNPLLALDNDGDRIPDDWERYYFGDGWDPKILPVTDSDGDNVINLTEYTLGLNPLNRDTDGGGVSDGDELIYGTNPRDPNDDFYPAFTISLRAGWNLVSLPVRLPDNSVSNIFPLSSGVYFYNTETRRYETVSLVEPGKAYFVLSLVDTSYTILSMPIETYTIPIKAGWNMIGSVYSRPVDITELFTEPAGILIYNSLYRYEPGSSYIRTTTIEPGVGYWILSLSNGTLTISEAGFERRMGGISTTDEEYVYNLYGQLPPSPPNMQTYTLPKDYALFQNKPNPFNSATTIEFAIPEDTSVRLTICNILGEPVRTLITGELGAGVHRVVWDAKDNEARELPSGVYLYKLETQKTTLVKRMLLLK